MPTPLKPRDSTLSSFLGIQNQ